MWCLFFYIYSFWILFFSQNMIHSIKAIWPWLKLHHSYRDTTVLLLLLHLQLYCVHFNSQWKDFFFALNTLICLFNLNMFHGSLHTSKGASSQVCTSEIHCFPSSYFLSIFPMGLLFCSEMVRACARQKRQRQTAYMPVARHFQENITKQTQTNKLGSLSASLSLPSAQTALPSLSGLPDMLIAL